MQTIKSLNANYKKFKCELSNHQIRTITQCKSMRY